MEVPQMTEQDDPTELDLVYDHLQQAADRIAALEAALRVAKEYVCDIHALRVINAALAPALCPTSDPSWPESQPCSVCGAFGPWFDTPQIGECVEATRAARAPEQDK